MIILHFSSEILTSSTPIMINPWGTIQVNDYLTLFFGDSCLKYSYHDIILPQVLLSWYNPWGTIQVNDYLTLFFGDSYLKYSYHDIILPQVLLSWYNPWGTIQVNGRERTREDWYQIRSWRPRMPEGQAPCIELMALKVQLWEPWHFVISSTWK